MGRIVTLQHYLRVLRRGWRWIALCVILAVGAAAALLYLVAPQYAATTRLFVTTPLSDAGLAGAIQGSEFTQQRVSSYAEIIESELMASRVIEAEELDVDPADLAKQVSASVLPETALIDVSVASSSAERAQTIAAAYAAEFVSLLSEIEKPPSGDDAIVSATVVNDARLPESPVFPDPTRTFALATILGLLVGVGVVVLRDALDTRVSNPEALSEITQAPLLGAIAYDSDVPKRPLILDIAPRSPRAEAFRQLRTNLQFVDIDVSRKVIVVTSSVPAEGKTTTAVNLAIALAQAGIATLLLDADLRRPQVASYLGLVEGAGLTDVLLGKVEVEDVIQVFGSYGLQVIASGSTPPNPSELLQSQAMVAFLKSVEDHAEVVLMDAPPLLPVADAAILSTLADGALLVTRCNRTTADQVRRATASLQQVGSRLLGTVFTMTPSKGQDAYEFRYGSAALDGKHRR